MWHVGSDRHRRTVVVAAVHGSGEVGQPKTFGCQKTDGIIDHFRRLKPFRVNGAKTRILSPNLPDGVRLR